MPLDLKIETDRLFAALVALQNATGKSMSVLLKQQSRLLMEQVLEYTPPGGGGVTGRRAYKQGERAIDFDLSNIFVAVRLKGRRKVTHAFGQKLKKPVYVPTKELHPNVAELHRQRLEGIRFRVRLKNRGRKNKYTVDVQKLNALRRDLRARIGKLASGWLPALRAVEARKIPQWVSNKSHGGTGKLYLSTDKVQFTATCPVKGNLVNELQRRVNSAIVIRAATIRRQIPFILAANARKALGQ